MVREVDQTWSFRGSKSRNKVSVGEPAEGSLLKTLGIVLLLTLCEVCARTISNLFIHLCIYCRRSLKSQFVLVQSWLGKGFPMFLTNLLKYALECSLLGLYWPFKTYTTFSNGSLGSPIDEERSEMR